MHPTVVGGGDDAGPPLLRMAGMSKTFPNGTEALRDVSLVVTSGTVHGLVGANGAGKSTLIKILAGSVEPTSGSITWCGQPVEWTSPADAVAAGAVTIHQHVPLVPSLSVLDNVFLGHHGVLRRRAPAIRQLEALFAEVGYSVDPYRLVSDLSIGERQMTAILQALSHDARLVVMDEPTASLAQDERDVVFAAIRRLRDNDRAVIFISHYLDEVLELTDAITVLRDGSVAVSAPTCALDEATLVEAIVGSRLLHAEERSTHSVPETANVSLSVRNLRIPGRPPVSFDVREGEILGIAGLLGSGRTRLLRTIFGERPALSGTVTIGGQRVKTIAEFMRAGGALVPEDRRVDGLLADWEIWRTVSLPVLRRFTRLRVLLDTRLERQAARAAIARWRIRTPDENTPTGSLSGGNAQKVVLAKATVSEPRVLLLDEPMAGIDVGAKTDIFDSVRAMAAKGCAVVVVSSEFTELLGLTHRVLVLAHGSIIADVPASATTEHELVALASGLSGPAVDIGSVAS